MPDAWNSVKIREFEHVLAAPTVALLRVSGKPPRRRLTVGPRPILVANDGQTIRRFAAIPSPPDDRGVLRAAYSVSSDLLAPNTTFSLELSDGTVVALPAPQPGVSRLSPDPGSQAPSEAPDAPEPPDGTDERRSGLVSKLTELSARLAESEQARDELQQSVVPMSEASERVEHELLGARERAARAETEVKQSAAALEELETWRGELERRLTETIDELSAAKISRAQDEAELLRLGGELAEAEAKVELLQAQVTTLADQLAQAEDRPETVRADTGAPGVPYSPSERASIAHQAGQLAALLGSAERLTELASELAGARAQAEILHAAASAEPPPQAASQAATEDALAVARAEIEDLRAELAQARGAEAQARVEAVGQAAEAEARELAEQELAQAASADL
jgi:septal ring factor EnvC (AmiA/AmiB activator)